MKDVTILFEAMRNVDDAIKGLSIENKQQVAVELRAHEVTTACLLCRFGDEEDYDNTTKANELREEMRSLAMSIIGLAVIHPAHTKVKNHNHETREITNAVNGN